MSVANSTMSLSNVVDPALVKVFDEVKNQLANKTQYTKFPFTEYEIETTADSMSSLSGFGPGELTIEGQSYALDYKYDGYDKTLVVRKYTKRVPWTEELEYFLQRRSASGVYKVNSMIKGMVQGLNTNWEQDFAKMFYLGFGTTFITGGDGLALFHASHTSTKPGVAAQSNIITMGATTNVELAAESLKTAMIQLDRIKDNVGQLISPSTNLALVASRQLLEKAFQIKKSEYGPDSANLGYGIVSPTVLQEMGKSFKVIPLHHMPDAYANYWFLVDLDKMQDMVVMAYAWHPRMHEKMKDIDGVSNILASTLFGPNPVDWRWIVGSTGANPLP